MSDADILILAAFREEITKLPRIDGVLAVTTGDGPLRASRGAAAAIERRRPRFVIGLGIAGAISEDLARGDLVVARSIIDEDGRRAACDERLVTLAAAAGAKQGTIVTSRAIASVEAKSKLASSIEGSAAIDLESAAWQREAAKHAIPFVSIRCIFDSAAENLPRLLDRCARPDGSVNRLRVVAQAALHPGEIPTLFELRRRTAASAALLGHFLETFVPLLRANG